MRFLKNKKNLIELGWLSSFALVTIPLGTLLFARIKPPSKFTLSMIGNMEGNRFAFIMWGVITGVLITFFVARLYMKGSFNHPKANKNLKYSLIFLCLTVIIPAVEMFPFLKKLHALMAVLFAVSLMVSLSLFIKHLNQSQNKILNFYTFFIWFIIGGSIVVFLFFGNTGYFELFFFFTLTIFLYILNKFLNKSENKIELKK